MTLTTTEVVTVDGVDLNTLAYNIETLTGRDALPPRRGENTGVAYRHGKRWKRKQYDSKTETWAMWIRGCDPDGNIPAAGARAEYNKNLFMLKQLFGKIDSQLELQRKVLMPSGLLVLTAKGECVSTMDPQMLGKGAVAARFSADIELANPLWYGAQQVFDVTTSGGALNNPGTALMDRMIVRFTGPATNPVLTNLTSGVWVKYTGTIAAGVSIDLDTDEFEAYDTGLTNRISKISHGKAVAWMELRPGVNNFSLTSGTAKITYNPGYV